MCSIGADIVLEYNMNPAWALNRPARSCPNGSPRCTSFDDFEDVIAQLNNGIHRQHTKQKDSNTVHRMNDKILRVRQVEAKFCATYYVATTAKQLLTSEGIIAPSNPMPGKALKPKANMSNQIL